MVVIDTIEGFIDDRVSYHYDVGDDLLYMRLVARRDTPTLGEEDDDGVIVFRSEEADEPVGITVVSWWKLHGKGPRPDSLEELGRLIEPWAKRIPAE